MDVFQALHQRRSVRAFLPQTPSADTVRSLMEVAARSASGGNLQPWRVLALTGEPLAQVLAAVDQGLATCAQGFWRRYDRSLAEHLQLPQPYCVAFGVALGYEDTAAPINTLQASRAPLHEWAELRGF